MSVVLGHLPAAPPLCLSALVGDTPPLLESPAVVATSAPLCSPITPVPAYTDRLFSGDSSSSEHHLRLVALASSYDHIFFGLGRVPDVSFDAHAFSRHLAELIYEFRPDAVFENAEAAAADFIWPADLWTADRDSLQRLGSVEAVIKEKHIIRQHSGFNPQRVDSLFAADPNYRILREIAEHGASIDTSLDFVRIAPETQSRPITSAIPKALGKHAAKLLSKHRAVLLPVDCLSDKQLQELSFCGLHLAFKTDELAGRLCIDPTNTPDEIVALNGTNSSTPAMPKLLSIARYGKVNLPSICPIMHQWCVWRSQQSIEWTTIYCYKEDVQSAFPQFTMNANSALKLACMIAVGLILIFTAGGFGWCGAPMVFDVIMAATFRLIKKKVKGPCDRYSDDVFGIGDLLSAAHDSSVVRSHILQTFGDGSVAIDKSWLDQHAIILGWHIDFVHNRVRPSDRGIRKLAHAFFSFNIRAGQPLTKWQELHSLAERYSDGLLCTSDFVQPLAAMLAGWEPVSKAASNTSRRRRVIRLRTANSAARFAIEMWRVFCIRLWQNCDSYSMTIEQFSGYYDIYRLSPRVAISDSSTPRVAVGIYDNLPDGSLNLIAWTGYNYPAFGYSEAHPSTHFQNQREFLGLLLSLILNASITTVAQSASQHVTWVNDNQSAISWASAGRCKSASGQLISMAVSWFQLCSNTHYHNVKWIPGTHMGDIDAESRSHEGMSAPSLVPDKYVDLQRALDQSGLMHACDPSLIQSSVTEHHEAFKRVHSGLSHLIAQIRDSQLRH
jgi:hypothetical protein